MSGRLLGQECIGDLCLVDGSRATVLHFWQWAFSDLKQNNVRGVFSEWLVAQILGLELPKCRESWDAYDLITPNGTAIEIKSAAYLQSWHDETCKPSSIVFSGLKGQTWSPKAGFSGIATYNADVYVFCLQTCTDASCWDATDINQWRFAYLKKAVLEAQVLKSLSLKRLMALTNLLTAAELRQEFQKEGFI